MKRTLPKILFLLLTLTGNPISAAGLFFNVLATGSVLTINTTIPNHTYSNAGISVRTPGYQLTGLGRDCQLNTNGYCLFTVSDRQTAQISISGPSGTVQVVLCLNGAGALSCQNYYVHIDNFLFTVGTYESGGIISPIFYRSTDFGATWQGPLFLTVPAGATNNKANSISCSKSGLVCSTVGNIFIGGTNQSFAWSTSDGGINWLPSVIPLSTANEILIGVSCSSDGVKCAAVGQSLTTGRPIAYFSKNSGRTWLASTVPAGATGSMQGVSCSSSLSTCTAVGLSFVPLSAVAYYSLDEGQTWFTSSGLDPIEQAVLFRVSCSTSGKNCASVGKTLDDLNLIAYTSENSGVTWTKSAPFQLPTNSLPTVELVGLGCSDSGTQCTAVGSASSATVDFALSYSTKNGGRTWSSPTLVPPPNPPGTSIGFNGLFCYPSGVLCFAVGRADLANPRQPIVFETANGGSNWEEGSPLSGDAGRYNLFSASGSH
ncbi:TPA: hypothetical protein F8R96_09525 [Legionella pneumophila]|nr:hypothetical protein [Legionella pneumophila]HAU1321179.1 hypothetical protein [Legionella pneumophila]HBI2946806.1 hypothetical protein [Legionella pneumophila]HDV6632743.1 hypothetical protein [Legionella pneumophila]